MNTLMLISNSSSFCTTSLCTTTQTSLRTIILNTAFKVFYGGLEYIGSLSTEQLFIAYTYISYCTREIAEEYGCYYPELADIDIEVTNELGTYEAPVFQNAEGALLEDLAKRYHHGCNKEEIDRLISAVTHEGMRDMIRSELESMHKHIYNL